MTELPDVKRRQRTHWARGLLGRVALFALALGSVAVWLAGQSAARRILLGGQLRYVPPGYTALVAAGSPRELWQGMARHFGGVLRDRAHPGPMSEGLEGIRRLLSERGVEIGRLADLERNGLDVDRGAVVALYRHPAAVLAVIATGADKPFRELVEKLTGEKARSARPVGSAPVLEVGNLLLAAPQRGLHVVCDSAELLRAALEDTRRNLTQAQRDDDLYDAAGLIGGQALAGPTIFFFVPNPEYPLVRRGRGVIRLGDPTLHATFEGEVSSTAWRVIKALFAAPPASGPWAHGLPASTPAAAAFDDVAIPEYIGFLSRLPAAGSFMRARHGKVLSELQSVPGLRRVVVVVTKLAKGMPEFMLGVWGDATGIDRMVGTLQARFRVERDLQLLADAAVARGAAPAVDVQQAGLEEEPGSLFGRYVLGSDGQYRPPALAARDFATKEYTRRFGAATVRFLLPPLTGNDVRYHPELAPLLSGSASERDRYRLAVAPMGDAYWFATDLNDLAGLLEETGGRRGPIEEEPVYLAASRSWSSVDRLRAFINMDQAIRLGLLSPENAVQDGLTKYLLDLRDHPAISVTMSTNAAHDRVRLEIRLELRDGLPR